MEPLKNISTVCDNYLPEFWTVRKDYIYSAIYAIQSGIEYAKELLVNHDATLGRTTAKNKWWAETIEEDINYMKIALRQLESSPEPTDGGCTPIVPDGSPCLPKS